MTESNTKELIPFKKLAPKHKVDYSKLLEILNAGYLNNNGAQNDKISNSNKHQ